MGSKPKRRAATTPNASSPGLPPRVSPQGLKKWVFRLATMTLIPALAFGLLEVGLRTFGYGYPTAFFVKHERPSATPLYVTNHLFNRRFFPANVAREPIPAAVTDVKAAGTYRTFVLGESAAQGYPDWTTSFARILEVMLRDRYPGTRFEVVNTASTAINSHVILPIARECAGHEPDLFIAYIGNNEVVGPFGAANVLGAQSADLRLIRSNLAVKRSRIGQLMNNVVGRLGAGKSAPEYFGGMEMFLGEQVAAADVRMNTTYAHFRTNLEDICRAATDGGAALLLCTVPVNLRDCAPFASMHAAGLAPEELADWERAFKSGTELEDKGKFAEAVAGYHEAARIDDQFADLQFRLARCYTALGNTAEAAARYALARDLDTLRFRADSRINETIRQVAAERASPAVRLVDAEREFAENSPNGVPGEDLFFEHVHMNFTGNHVLARSVLKNLHEVLPPAIRARARVGADALSERECAERLAYTEWNRFQDTGEIRNMFRSPPFTNQLDAAEREARWAKRLQELSRNRQPEPMATAIALSRKAVADAPDDWMLRSRFAQLLAAAGDVDEGIRQYQAALQRYPFLHGTHYWLGTLLLRVGRLKEARASFQAALELAPGSEQPQYGLADVLAAEGNVDQAIAAYSEIVRKAPDRSQALVRMASFLNLHGRRAEARERLKEAIQVQPNDPHLHVHLGNTYANEGNVEAAIGEFETALRLRPRWPEMVEYLAQLRKSRDEGKPAPGGR